MSDNLQAWKNYEVTCAAADPFTNRKISPAVGARQRFEVAELKVTVAAASTVTTGVAVRVGFGASTLPAASGVASTPAVGILLSHAGIAPGSGLFGLAGMGDPDQDLLATVADPVVGSVVITFRGRVIDT